MDSLKDLSKKYPRTFRLLQNYIALNFGSVKVCCPYWMNDVKKHIRGPYGGKGTPGQIRYITRRLADKNKINLPEMTPNKISEFMRQNRIGVDCSGFSYTLLNQIDKEKGGNGIADNIFTQKSFPEWNPKWRASANLLTGSNVSRQISNLNEIQIGDMIRMDSGKHMAVVVGVNSKSIMYAHSSKFMGAHVNEIKLENPGLGLEKQSWLEKTVNGEDINKSKFVPKNGDSIRRFKWW